MLEFKGKKIPELNEIEKELMNLQFCGGSNKTDCIKMECKDCINDSHNIEEFREWFGSLFKKQEITE